MADRATRWIEADGDRAACDFDARCCRCRQSNRRERRRQIHRQRRSSRGNERRLRRRGGGSDRRAKRSEVDVHALERHGGAGRAKLEVQRGATGGRRRACRHAVRRGKDRTAQDDEEIDRHVELHCPGVRRRRQRSEHDVGVIDVRVAEHRKAGVVQLTLQRPVL